MTQKILEKDIQKAILDYLIYRNITAWRTNSGMSFRTYKDKVFVQRMAPKGTSDIIGILNDGRFLAIEVKRPGKKATEEQQKFIDMINKKGGLAFVATSIDDVSEKI